jgi:hypothetical protein
MKKSKANTNAPQEEAKPHEVDEIVKFMLKRIDTSSSYDDKVTVSITFFEYVYNNPVIFTPLRVDYVQNQLVVVTTTPDFKEAVWDKMNQLDDELADILYHIPATIDPNDRHTRTSAIHLLDMINRVRERYYY